jgi:small-conductance mechanosensitive channel
VQPPPRVALLASAGTATTTSPVLVTGNGTSSGGGWLYDLLTKAGVSSSAAHTTVEFVFRPLEVVLVIAVAALVARYGAHLIRRALGRVAHRAADRSASGRAGARSLTVVALLANLWRFFVVVVAIATILGMLGIDLTPLLASATVIGATIGFGAQSLVRDYLSGILLAVEDQFGIGDTINVNETVGVVEDLSLRVTRIRGSDGTVWYVPNGEIRRLANTSRGWAKAVVDLPVAPAAAARLREVADALADAARLVARRPAFAASTTDPPEVLGMTDAVTDACTVRVALRTSPIQRDALERALRQDLVARLVRLGAWPGLEPAASDGADGAGGPPERAGSGPAAATAEATGTGGPAGGAGR